MIITHKYKGHFSDYINPDGSSESVCYSVDINVEKEYTEIQSKNVIDLGWEMVTNKVGNQVDSIDLYIYNTDNVKDDPMYIQIRNFLRQSNLEKLLK